MKKFFLTSLVAVLACGVADACPTLGLARARTKTVTTTKQTIKLEPKTVVTEKTVLVPTKVQVTETKLVPTPGPTVTETKIKTTLRGRVLGAIPCPGCK